MNSFEPIFWSIVFIESASAHSFLCVRLQLAIESGNYCFAGSKESLFGRSISSPFNGLCCWIRGSPHCPNTRGVWYTDWVDSSTSDLLLTSLRSTFSMGSLSIFIPLFWGLFAFHKISTSRKNLDILFSSWFMGKFWKIAKAKKYSGTILLPSFWWIEGTSIYHVESWGGGVSAKWPFHYISPI